MSDSESVNLLSVKADAELMSAWLGGVNNTEISPKLLFDLQNILRHYADFIVPNKEIKVEYPTEGTPCASVKEDRVMIPVDMLEDGRVDETISAVIHELHHIKLSDKEDYTIGLIYPYAKLFLNSIEINYFGTKMSIYQALQTEGSFTAEEVYFRTLNHKYAPFIYQVFGDLFFVINVIEDVRIDELQPDNLKKYRLKQERLAFAKFEDAFNNGDIDRDSLHGSLLSALFCYKDLGTFPLAEDDNLTKEFIVNCNLPEFYFPNTFKVFGDVAQNHIGGLWKQMKDQNSEEDSAISTFLAEEQAGDDSENGNDTQDIESLDIKKIKASQCPQVDAEFAQQARDVYGEEKFNDLLKAMANKGDNSSEPPTKKVLSNAQWAEIQSFSKLKHVPCREDFTGEDNLAYDTLIYDCYA